MDRRVVITGMGIVSPIGCGTEQFEAALTEGVCGIGPITRFDTADFKVKVAAEVKDDFDPLKYLSKIEVKKMDRFTRYAMCAALEAVGQSGIVECVDPAEFGVYYGSGIGGFETFVEEHDTLLSRGPGRVSPMFIPKMIGNIAAGQIAIRFGAKGPCISITTACATGTGAIGEAYRAIRHGYCEAAVTGGAEATIHPLAVAGFQNMTALSLSADPMRASIPFDKERAGFVMGEGAGALVLESYEHAVSRGAEIFAEVVGYGSTCDAHHITAPDPEAEASGRAFSQALKEAGYTADDVVYINAHGTGTPLNDVTETNAIKRAFGEDARRVRISSTKSMTGHMLGAAGAAEAIASVLALRSGVIPPTVHLNVPDPDCDLDYTPNQAVLADPTLALSSSLGFGGHNSVIALRKI
ncbi:MAG: beta-ketoacyl-[acyl-carrier-protein] synthase II [Ruminococcaceae bacterium]|jgi:3-oxoacyl-[acyl-carrier-protein] synthase II|nr:beta-ketoacyl-[acyl-carrier-protein] synthase II [Oscillospiraceae bacterium]